MKYDALFAGGGLANALTAFRLKQLRPDLKVKVLERARVLPNRTWSFHGTDLSTEAFRWFHPLISRSWSGYEVRFPQHSRALTGNYHSVESGEFYEKIRSALGESWVDGCEVLSLSENSACVSQQGKTQTWEANVVFDGRGWEGQSNVPCAYQKFLGQRVKLSRPHGLTRPVIMDATVVQKDGYRFFYLLPWSENELMLEDTRYSNTGKVDADSYRQEIAQFLGAMGFSGFEVVYEEVGSLPIPLSGFPEFPHDGSIPWGTRAGFFHATTGYSLPNAVEMTERLVRLAGWSSRLIRREVSSWCHAHWAENNFFRVLNRMMFFAASPEKRYQILQRFYLLPEGLIERFYAGKLGTLDQLRILSGRPPVPVGRAVKSLFQRGEADEPRVLS